MINILAIGRNEEILAVVVRLLNANSNWKGEGASTDELALSLFAKTGHDIVLLCGGIYEQEETKLREKFQKQRPDVIILQHYGGGSGLLSGEIQYALERR